MGTTIIGIDCAAQDENIGIALARYEDGSARIDCVESGGEVRATLNQWVKDNSPALLALDAPLGWPIGMRRALRSHRAGKPLWVDRESMFRRLTDRFVECIIRKRPLDVGADRIARTAHAALDLLKELRRETGHEIPLRWAPGPMSRTCAIEVYPAGTLMAHVGKESFQRFKGYKGKQGETSTAEARQRVEDELDTRLQRGESVVFNGKSVHRLDAAICVLAGMDFLNGDVFRPEEFRLERRVIRKEGWIWVRKPV